MESPQPAPPVSRTGLPPGVEVGGLAKRFLAHLIDRVVPALLGVVAFYLAPRIGGTEGFVIQIAAVVMILAWVLLVWWGFAVRAAGPGMRLMQLQLVGFYDGRPIGWIRYLLRTLVLWALSATGIGLLLMLIFLLIHPRKQGWHDLVVHAVVIKQRALAPPRSKAGAEQRRAPQPIPQAQQDQVAAMAPYSGVQPQGAPEPLVPPAGVEANHSPMPGPPTAQSVPAHTNSHASAEGQPSPIGNSSAAAMPPPLAPPEGVPAGAPARPVEGSPPSGTRFPIGEEATPTTKVRAVSLPGPRDENAQVGWVVVLDDGREIAVNGLVLLGRNPQPHPGEEDAQLIKIADDTRTVSKSHLAIATDVDGAFVVDRGSTNGSTVTTTGGVSTKCQVGERVRVAEGSIVSIGDHWLEIRRRSD
jgi:uncharacterized RDD family membrane protein YckC